MTGIKKVLQKWGLISAPEPNKKVYHTTWSHHRFGDDQRDKVDVVLPDDISYQQLSVLPGCKTKVTIEIMPW